jgi:hypothetical protein
MEESLEKNKERTCRHRPPAVLAGTEPQRTGLLNFEKKSLVHESCLATSQIQRAAKAAHAGFALHPVHHTAERLINEHPTLHSRNGRIDGLEELLRCCFLCYHCPGSFELLQKAALVHQSFAAWASVGYWLTCMRIWQHHQAPCLSSIETILQSPLQ